ncbi:MAG: hypothetical protein WCP73_08250 [Eubacteriales bacterium]
MKCDLQEECYFNRTTIPEQKRMGEIYRDRYCEGDCTICARYQVHKALGADGVPQSLYPNMQEVAINLISNPD